MKTFALLLPWLVAVSVLGQTWENEPETYRGVKTGATHKEAVAIIGKKALGCIKLPGSGPETWVCNGGLTIGDIYVNDSWFFPSDVLRMVSWKFKSADYPAVRGVFLEKYGASSTTKNEKVKTTMGVEQDQEELTWTGRKMVIQLSRFGSNTSDGEALFYDKQFMEMETKRKADALAKAKDSF